MTTSFIGELPGFLKHLIQVINPTTIATLCMDALVQVIHLHVHLLMVKSANELSVWIRVGPGNARVTSRKHQSGTRKPFRKLRMTLNFYNFYCSLSERAAFSPKSSGAGQPMERRPQFSFYLQHLYLVIIRLLLLKVFAGQRVSSQIASGVHALFENNIHRISQTPRCARTIMEFNVQS